MIQKIFYTLFEIIIGLINLLLYPIDNLIDTFLPDISDMLTSISSFLEICFSCISWCINALGIPPTAITFILIYYEIKLTIPIVLYAIKLVLSWYRSLKV